MGIFSFGQTRTTWKQNQKSFEMAKMWQFKAMQCIPQEKNSRTLTQLISKSMQPTFGWYSYEVTTQDLGQGCCVMLVFPQAWSNPRERATWGTHPILVLSSTPSFNSAIISLAESSMRLHHNLTVKEVCSISSQSRFLAYRPCQKLKMFCPSVLQLS